MKKLKLTGTNLNAADMLTREQLKNVLGGDDISATGNCQEFNQYCNSADYINCCNHLVCADYFCGIRTL